MPKKQGPKLQGAVVNIPVDLNKTFNKLPSCVNVYLVKLRKKLLFKGYVFFRQLIQKRLEEH